MHDWQIELQKKLPMTEVPFEIFFHSIISRASGSSKRGTPPFGAQRKLDEKSAALRTVQDFMSGRSSRNQSPARSGPPSGTQTPVEGTRSPSNQVTEDKVIKVTKSTIEEFLSCRDLKVSNLISLLKRGL